MVLTAKENLVITRMELAMKYQERIVDGNVLETDQKDLLRIIEGPRMTASSRTNSHTDICRID